MRTLFWLALVGAVVSNLFFASGVLGGPTLGLLTFPLSVAAATLSTIAYFRAQGQSIRPATGLGGRFREQFRGLPRWGVIVYLIASTSVVVAVAVLLVQWRDDLGPAIDRLSAAVPALGFQSAAAEIAAYLGRRGAAQVDQPPGSVSCRHV